MVGGFNLQRQMDVCSGRCGSPVGERVALVDGGELKQAAWRTRRAASEGGEEDDDDDGVSMSTRAAGLPIWAGGFI